MKILVTTLAIALTIGTAIAALHPPGESAREDKPASPARSFFFGPAPLWWSPPAASPQPWPDEPATSIPISPPTRVRTVAYREVWVFSDFPPFPTKPVKTIPIRPQ